MTAASFADIAEAGERVLMSVVVSTFGGGSVATMSATSAGALSFEHC